VRTPDILPLGDRALVIRFDEKISIEINRQVTLLESWISKSDIAGIQEMIPAFRTLTVFYDPLMCSFESLCKQITNGIHHLSNPMSTKKIIYEIPVCYEGEFALDLKDLSEYTGLSVKDIVSIHTKEPYYIYMLGFLPGFPYLGGLDDTLSMPRLKKPRAKVAAGSVGIAGNQTGIYPVESPGGWRIIGQTPLTLFDTSKNMHVPYRAGDWIQFYSVSKKEFYSIQTESKDGNYQWVKREEEDSEFKST
jgi:inhibitor of KinA